MTYTCKLCNCVFVFSFFLCMCVCCRVGLDLFGETVRDNKAAGVLEPAMCKVKSLKFATEAAITILRIDDLIKLAPEEKRDRDDPHMH